MEEVAASGRRGAAYVAMLPTVVGFVSCNQDTCMESFLAKYVEYGQWAIAVSAVSNAVQCDNCFMMVPVKAIHRSGLSPPMFDYKNVGANRVGAQVLHLPDQAVLQPGLLAR